MAFTKITAAGIDTSGTVTTESISVSGISTVGSLSIGNTSVISAGRQLQNIASLDATTTATIESAITNAPNTFTDLNITGISTLGIATASSLVVSGISTLGVTSTTNLTAQSLSVSGISTFTNGPILVGTATSTGTASQRLQITGGAYVSGSVGIGTTNPQTALHLGGGGNIRLNRSDNTRSSLIFHDNNGFNINANTSGDDVTINAGNASGRILLQNNSSTTLTAQSGTVLVGTATSTGTASQRLQVTGGAYVSGSVGIGITNPQAALHVVGSGTTALLVSGNARITGILTVGTSSLTFDGNSNVITGLSTISGSFNFAKPNLSGISSSIASTAVDVFVYDTRKDSDGGAWRKRTQNTSWYNETLNTATRGSRKDFPAVAVIVATSTTVTIYDGDDPDMPMWMVFNAGSAGMSSTVMLQQTGHNKVVCMLNGILVTGTENSAGNYGQPIINFISEKVLRMDSESNEGGIWLGNIADRNSSKGYASSNEDYVIASSQVNDIAMTVLPSAPIDAATGLPVPTIAVATQSGVSIIKDDGTVTNPGGTITTKISINEKGIVYFASTSNGGYYGYSLVGGSLDSFFNTVGNLRILSNVNSNTNNNLVVPNAFNLYSGQTIGLTIVNKDFLNTYNDYNGMVAYATTSYNTGWMYGNIKGAWLSDTSTASVTGTELVTNGTFAGNLNGWTLAGDTTPTYDSATGGAKIMTAAAVDGNITQTITSTTGVIVTFDITARTSGFVGLSLNGSLVLDGLTALQTHTYYPDNAITSIALVHRGGGGGYAIVDNVSVRREELDRSVNNKGLAVYGTLTKTAVATGSNLIGYTNSSNTSNYLVLPLSSSIIDLTSNFSISYWFNCDGTGYNGWSIVENDISAQSAYTKTVLNWFVQTATTMGYRGSSITGSLDISYSANVWNCIVITKSSIGIQMYMNGILISTTSGTCVNPTVPYSLRLFQWSFGTSFYGSAALKMSLFRLSQSVPSPTQILKIYNDEKVLFQENSQCTLYGASDAVTALAYDDTTKLLSVGTSSGRSDFQGLERINNTTTAVTTAISASNGLIVEQ